MSKDDLINFLLQTSKGELIELLHEISATELNELDIAIQSIEEIIELKE